MAHSVLSKRVASAAKRRPWVRYFSWSLEALGSYSLWAVCSLLPTRAAARFGGWLITSLGPRSHKQKHVLASLTIVLRGDRAAAERASRAHWRNLGMILGEYPHLRRLIANTPVEVNETTRAWVGSGRACVFVGGHIANWEVAAGAIEALVGPFAAVYSAHANPLIDRALRFFRERAVRCFYLDKDSSLRAWLKEGKAGRSLGLLADQRVDDAPLIPFFGVAAEMTQTPARLALRLDLPLIPFHVERDAAAKYRVVFGAPLATPQADAKSEAATADLTARWVAVLEQRIEAAPGAWLCAKRRWPKAEMSIVDVAT